MELPRTHQIGGTSAHQRYGFFCGITMQKAWTELFQIEAILNEYQPDRIIELGAGSGGTTIFLGLQGLVRNIPVYSYDIGSSQPEQKMLDETASVLNTIETKYEEVDIYTIVEQIGTLIAKEGRTLLYCDAGGTDGGKSECILAFHKYLKRGDLVLVHDYNTPEFTLANADAIASIASLTPWNQDWLNKFDAKHGAFIK